MRHNRGLGFCFLGLFLFTLGCSPAGRTLLSPGSSEDLQDCLNLFPSGPWESVHRIEADLGAGLSSQLIGVTRGDPLEIHLQSLLLSPEGFTLFDGELRKDKVVVRKAVSPFDSPSFAQGMMEDVAFLFFSPQIRPVHWGRTAEGTRLCFWEGPDGVQTEVRRSPGRGWQILRRDDQGRVIKEVSLKEPFVQGLASFMELESFKPVSYKLKMTLIPSGP
jgi:hypothetical protein